MARIPDPSKALIIGDSIGDILAEARIELGRARLVPGRSVKTLCPACGGGGSRERSLSVKLDDDQMGVTWHCFRGGCGGNRLVPGGGRLEGVGRDEAPRRRERPPVVKPTLHAEDEKQRPPSLYDLFAKRGISQETVDTFGVYGISRRWPQMEHDPDKGKLVEVRDGDA